MDTARHGHDNALTQRQEKRRFLLARQCRHENRSCSRTAPVEEKLYYQTEENF
jgi:hypothetical protein